VEALADATQWKPKTIKTLLNRLVQKKALGFKKIGKAYEYYPLIDEDQCVRSESRSFLSRVYGGALAPMLATFLENEKLSTEEIDNLKQILDSKEES
jgi:BlaI family penicillinase repressor